MSLFRKIHTKRKYKRTKKRNRGYNDFVFANEPTSVIIRKEEIGVTDLQLICSGKNRSLKNVKNKLAYISKRKIT